jgi:hypothetical protein
MNDIMIWGQEVVKPLREAAKLLSGKLQDEALNIANRLALLAPQGIRPLACAWTEDGELIAELIFDGRRIGFSFDPNEGKAHWNYIDWRIGRMLQQGGELTTLNLYAVLQTAITK